MSTTTTSAKPPRNNAAPEPRVFRPSEPDDFGPIIELGPIEPGMVEHDIPRAGGIQTTADFNPTPSLAEQILTDASNPRIPLHIIAAKAQTTIEALQAWLAKPEIADRLDNILLSIRQRSKLKLAHELDNITEACATILERFNRAPDRGATDDRRPDTELRASNIITRNASNALMASRVLLTLARYLDGPPRASRSAHTPSNPLPNPNPDPNRPPSTSTLPPPTSHFRPLRLLPSLASVDLHDFREYLTSNHHKEPLASARGAPVPTQSPRGNAGGAKATQPPSTPGRSPPKEPRASAIGEHLNSPTPATTHPPASAIPSHQSSRSSESYPRMLAPESGRTPCACGPIPRTICPRSRDPTPPH